MIPNIIHHAWFSNDPKPRDVLECLASWQAKCPTFTIKEWSQRAFPIEQYPFAQEAFEERKYAFVTDVFRLWVLSRYGGVYLDSDVHLSSNLNPIIIDRDIVLGLELKDRIGPHIIAARKGHPFILHLLAIYEKRRFRLPDGTLDLTEMPRVMTAEFIRYYNCEPTCSNAPAGMEILPPNVATVNAHDGRSIAVHMMRGSWKSEDRNLPYYYLFLRRHFWDEYIELSLAPQRSSDANYIKLTLTKLRRTLCLLAPYGLVLRIKARRKGSFGLLKP